MKIIIHLLAIFIAILVAACGGGSSSSVSGSAPVVAVANETAQSLTMNRDMVSFTPLSVSGGVKPYLYSVAGVLPPGLVFSVDTGVVSGTPNKIYSTTPLVFSVKDANGVVANTKSSVLFTVGADTPTIQAIANTITIQSLTAGSAMASFSPLTASGGVWPYIFSYAGTLPTGLKFDASTGAVSGTPDVMYATANVVVFSVKDANNVEPIDPNNLSAKITSTVSFSVAAAPNVATSYTAAFNAALTLYAAKNYAGAASAFDSMIVAYPTSTILDTAYLYLGKSLHHLKDYSGAIVKFDTVLTMYKGSSFLLDARLWKGKSQYELKKYNEALVEFQAVLAAIPTPIPTPSLAIAADAQYHKSRTIHALAKALVPTYTYDLARIEYNLVITKYSTSAWVDNAQFQIGKTYYDQPSYEFAIIEFKNFLTTYPASTIADSAQYYLARSIHALALVDFLGNVTPRYTFQNARDAYGLVNSYPNSTYVDNAQYEIGKTYYDAQNYVSAILEFDKVFTYPASTVADGAQYHKARSIHWLALATTPTYTFQIARDEYFKVNFYPTSIYRDNAAYYSALTYHDSKQCALELTAMTNFVTAYPASTAYVAWANTHIDGLPPINGTQIPHTCK